MDNIIGKLRSKLAKKLSPTQQKQLRHFIIRNKAIGVLVSLFWGRNLTKLAIFYNTDKWGEHHYIPYYKTHFSPFRYKKISLLEIGVGGYDRPDKGGNSLRMWKRYFPFGKIYSIDIYDKSPQEEKRIKIFKGSQIDHDFLDKVIDNIGNPLDIIIDDGSHINGHVIDSFQYLFPKLNHGGIYIIEDTQTSYWDDYSGDSNNLNNPNTTMNFFKKIPDCLNHNDFNIKDYVPNYFDKNIKSIHFYHNLIFIHKGLNND